MFRSSHIHLKLKYQKLDLEQIVIVKPPSARKLFRVKSILIKGLFACVYVTLLAQKSMKYLIEC